MGQQPAGHLPAAVAVPGPRPRLASRLGRPRGLNYDLRRWPIDWPIRRRSRHDVIILGIIIISSSVKRRRRQQQQLRYDVMLLTTCSTDADSVVTDMVIDTWHAACLQCDIRMCDTTILLRTFSHRVTASKEREQDAVTQWPDSRDKELNAKKFTVPNKLRTSTFSLTMRVRLMF